MCFELQSAFVTFSQQSILLLQDSRAGVNCSFTLVNNTGGKKASPVVPKATKAPQVLQLHGKETKVNKPAANVPPSDPEGNDEWPGLPQVMDLFPLSTCYDVKGFGVRLP